MSISVDDCIDLDAMERLVFLAKVKDLVSFQELLKHMYMRVLICGLRICWGRWVWLEFDSLDHMKDVFGKNWWLPLVSWAPRVYKQLVKLSVGKAAVFTDMVSDGPMSHGKVYPSSNPMERRMQRVYSFDESLEMRSILDVDSCDSDLS
ncbi:hypothetical protein Tco_1129295 [Tanacetum coccineum]